MTPSTTGPGSGPQSAVAEPPTCSTVSVVGSTGSIGTQTLDVVAEDPGRYRVVALGAQRSVDLLITQALAVRPDVVAIGDSSLAH